MGGFWYPYRGAQDALVHLGPFADHAVGHGCGISFSDGRLISVVRRPSGSRGMWLNVLSRHIATSRPRPKPRPPTAWQKVEHWFEDVMTAYGESQMREAEAKMATSRAVTGYVDRNIWQPAHAWLLRHKLVNDAVGVAADVVGVVAGVVFICTIGPELGVVAVIAGAAAGIGSLVLLGMDGYVLGGEITGHEADTKWIETSENMQWARIVATLMTVPDMAVGGVRALKEVGALAGEAREANVAARTATTASEAERARVARIRNPSKHPHAVQKHLHKARRYAAAANQQLKMANKAARQAANIATRDVTAAYGATPTGAALLAFNPPGVMLTERQKTRDGHLLQQIAPEGGMPRNVRLDMRVGVLGRRGQ